MKKGMIKLSVLYPNEAGKRFDMDYYTTQHVQLLGGLLGDAVKGASIEKGIAGGPGQPPAYVAIGHLYFESLEAFQRSFGPHAEEIMADVPNYTDITPVVQMGEVVV